MLSTKSKYGFGIDIKIVIGKDISHACYAVPRYSRVSVQKLFVGDFVYLFDRLTQSNQ